jgi:hypothetical protein
MTIYAQHDSTGMIRSLVVANAPAGGGMTLRPKAGLFVAEVEDLTLHSSYPHFEELRQIARSYRVANPGGSPRCTLMKRS